jgi:hypothetical protein
VTDKMVIEGSIIRHIREQVIAEAPLADMAPHLITRLPTIFPVLPSTGATRYLGFDPQSHRGLILVELQPRTHNIVVQHQPLAHSRYRQDAERRNADDKSVFKVALPFTYFLFAFNVRETLPGILSNFTVDGASLWFRREPIREYTDTLIPAQVPNVDSGGGICWGSTVRPQNSLSAHIDAMINEFFHTTFNEDLGHRTPFGTSLLEWERNSVNPMAYYNWPMWEEEFDAITLNDLWQRNIHGIPAPDVMQLNPSFVEMPELPPEFTVLYAKEWLAALPEAARNRMITAATQVQEQVTA